MNNDGGNKGIGAAGANCASITPLSPSAPTRLGATPCRNNAPRGRIRAIPENRGEQRGSATSNGMSIVSSP
jgi:hypothetical protein